MTTGVSTAKVRKCEIRVIEILDALGLRIVRAIRGPFAGFREARFHVADDLGLKIEGGGWQFDGVARFQLSEVGS